MFVYSFQALISKEKCRVMLRDNKIQWSHAIFALLDVKKKCRIKGFFSPLKKTFILKHIKHVYIEIYNLWWVILVQSYISKKLCTEVKNTANTGLNLFQNPMQLYNSKTRAVSVMRQQARWHWRQNRHEGWSFGSWSVWAESIDENARKLEADILHCGYRKST